MRGQCGYGSVGACPGARDVVMPTPSAKPLSIFSDACPAADSRFGASAAHRRSGVSCWNGEVPARTAFAVWQV